MNTIARRFRLDIARQLAGSWRMLATISVMSGLTLTLLFNFSPVPVGYLFREPYSIGHIPSYVGLLSNFGAMLWCCTVGICLFTCAVLRTRGVAARRCSMLLCAAAFSFLLLLDDVLMLHERVFGTLLPNGQLATYVVYGAAVACFCWRFRTNLLRSDYLTLVLSAGLLGASAGLDVLKEVLSIDLFAGALHVVVEDGLKLMGIILWLLYFARLSQQHIAQSELTARVLDRAPIDESRSRWSLESEAGLAG